MNHNRDPDPEHSMSKRHLLVLIFSLFACTSAFAEWTLNNTKSSLNFVSTKAIDIAEVHHFTQLVGRVSNNGKAVITIELASVETGIPIRNERMLGMLFETRKFPLSTVRAKIDMDIVNAIATGASKNMAIELELDLHGVRVEMAANVVVVRLDESTLMVSSAGPVILNASTVELSAGIEMLREVASLPSIGNAVPVTFNLTFEQTE
jgi:polyisoprenoid-binding protein YceI